MRLIKPSWIHHEGKPIFSIDVHPSGKKFATGGQGGDSGRVVIWNWAPLVSPEQEKDPNVPKILCLMDQHLACVNCVRWSWSGIMLASAGDDRLIKIWKESAGSGGAVFGSKVVNKENWKCTATLQIHQGDILDLSWSPGDRWLMSCSIDNSIIIWDTATFTVKEQISGHTGMVKGVVWDPVGKYLASQSDDKSVRVWRTSDWMQEAIITEPFAKCGGTTHVLRLSWSPDGQYLVSAHAMNGRGPTAQIIERDGWSSDKDFVGHRKAVTCVRFNNNIMERGARQGSRPVKYCCLAIGSRDCALSVWCTSDHRPLFAVHDLFTKSVMDLSWSADGLSLLACSWDGSVACLHFKSEEMGRLLTSSEKNALYERLYGQSAENINDSGSRTIIESCDLLDEPIKNATSQMNGNDVHKPMSEINLVPSIKINEKVDDKIKPSAPVTPKPINKQIETRTSDGRRRITPMFIPANQELGSVQNGTTTFASAANAATSVNTNSAIALPKPTVTVSNSLESTVSKSLDESQLDSKLKRSLDLPVERPLVPEKASRMDVTHTTVSQAQPMVPFTGTILREAGKYKIQLTNNVLKTQLGPLHTIKVFNNIVHEKKLIWQYYTGSSIVHAACSVNFISVACEDLTLHCLETSSGRPLLPLISLPGPCVRLIQSPSGYMAAFTSNAHVHVWSISDKKALLRETYSHLLMDATLSNCALTNSGMPIISFSNGKSYTYCKDLQTWLILCNPRDPVMRIGMWSVSKCAPPPRGQPLSIAQHSINTSSMLYGPGNACQHAATQSFLETQLSASEALKSAEDFRYWLEAFVEHLGAHGPESALRRVLDDLLGPAVFTSKEGRSQFKREILGLDKQVLLKSCLRILRKHIKWQRIYMEYSDQIEEIRALNL